MKACISLVLVSALTFVNLSRAEETFNLSSLTMNKAELQPLPAPELPALHSRGEVPRTVRGLSQAVAQIVANPDPDLTASEKAVLAYLAKAHEKGVLYDTIRKLLDIPFIQPHLPPELIANKEAGVRQLYEYVKAELESAGVVSGIEGDESWADMSERHLLSARTSAFAPRGRGQASLFLEPGFIAEFQNITRSRFVGGNSADFLVNGPASFGERERLITNARKSVYIMTWAIYDDNTGAWALDLLARKKKEGVDVKIIVDAKVVNMHGKDILPRYEAAGIEIAYYTDSARSSYGTHCKLLIVDGEHVIAGGMNFGDEYSHMGSAPKWRDTDVLVRGPAAAQFNAFFSEVWTKQAGRYGLTPAARGVSPSGGAGSARVALTWQNPGQESHVMLGILKAVYGASSRINIENAYFIQMPALKTALLEALARGVQVNIYTNSAESIDEPMIAMPILKSLPDLMAAGARVFLKRGATLHSKFLTVDGVFCNIGSFNIHPRSIRYEKEMVVNILDPRKTAELEKVFQDDVSGAREIVGVEQLGIKDSLKNDLIKRYLFNQL